MNPEWNGNVSSERRGAAESGKMADLRGPEARHTLLRVLNRARFIHANLNSERAAIRPG